MSMMVFPRQAVAAPRTDRKARAWRQQAERREVLLLTGLAATAYAAIRIGLSYLAL